MYEDADLGRWVARLRAGLGPPVQVVVQGDDSEMIGYRVPNEVVMAAAMGITLDEFLFRLEARGLSTLMIALNYALGSADEGELIICPTE